MSGWWLGVAVLLVLLVAAFGVTRAVIYYRGIQVPPPLRRLFPARRSARQQFFSDVCALQKRADASQISVRATAQELGFLVRGFATTVTGIDATHLTLRELKSRPRLRPAAAVIARLYEAEFDREHEASVGDELREARRMAEQWY